MIKVAVTGALGRMGTEVVTTVLNDPEMELVCAIDKFKVGEEIAPGVKISDDIETAFKASTPDVVVDFTQPDIIYENAKKYIKMGIKSVIGTTGLMGEQVEEIKKLSTENNVGCIIVPNFTVGAVLMMMFAQTAAKYFNNAEIIEFHHNQKKDAPSGTAIKTAQMMAKVNKNLSTDNVADTELLKGARGGVLEEGKINIHAVRMPGFMASQEVIFGALGQTLKIRHDSTDRKCYMGGVTLCVKHIYSNNDFVYGLENIL